MDALLGAPDKDDDIDSAEQAELWELRETMRRNPNIRLLFNLSKKARPEDVKKFVNVLKALEGIDMDDGD